LLDKIKDQEREKERKREREKERKREREKEKEKEKEKERKRERERERKKERKKERKRKRERERERDLAVGKDPLDHCALETDLLDDSGATRVSVELLCCEASTSNPLGALEDVEGNGDGLTRHKVGLRVHQML